MHRLENRVYAVDPGETVRFGTRPNGSAAVRVQVDGVEASENGSFIVSGTPGDQSQLTISLFGAPGTTCVVGIADVDGGTDGDMLVCQSHDPAPVHFYRFIVVQPHAMATMNALLGGAAL